MKNYFTLRISLLALLLAACAPSTDTTNPPAGATQGLASALPSATVPAPTLEPATEAAPSEAATAVPLATSRGSNLEAIDPTTVSLASGGLQFVEFFRFT
jgi:hypothetical protein